MGNITKEVRNLFFGGLTCALLLASGCSDSPKPADNTPTAPAPPAATATTVAPTETPAAVPDSVPATELQEIEKKTLATGKKIYRKDGTYFGEVVSVSEKEIRIKTSGKSPEGAVIETETGMSFDALQKGYMTVVLPDAVDATPTPAETPVATPAATPEVKGTPKPVASPLSKEELEKKKKDDGAIEILPPHPAKEPAGKDEKTSDKTAAPPVKPATGKKGIPEVPPVIGEPEGETEFYTLTGVMSTSSGKTAMLKMGDKTISANAGDKLSDDWQVVSVSDKSITLRKGTETRKLDLKND